MSFPLSDQEARSSVGRTEKRALLRGVRVLKMLQMSPASTLHELHKATRIAKPPLLRILGTLEREGMIRRRLDDGRYCISAKFTRGNRKPNPLNCLEEAAAPVLRRLCRKISCRA